jgi:acyl carrier protein
MSVAVTQEHVEAKVYESLIEFGADPHAVTRHARWEDLRVDSLDLVELVQVVEEEYGVQITGEDIKQLPTVGDVIDLVVDRSAS